MKIVFFFIFTILTMGCAQTYIDRLESEPVEWTEAGKKVRLISMEHVMDCKYLSEVAVRSYDREYSDNRNTAIRLKNEAASKNGNAISFVDVENYPWTLGNYSYLFKAKVYNCPAGY